LYLSQIKRAAVGWFLAHSGVLCLGGVYVPFLHLPRVWGRLAFPARGPYDTVVAEFFGDSPSGFASTFGKISFSPSYTQENIAGTYTGTVHFKSTCLGIDAQNSALS